MLVVIGGPTVPQLRCRSEDAGSIMPARPPEPRSLRALRSILHPFALVPARAQIWRHVAREDPRSSSTFHASSRPRGRRRLRRAIRTTRVGVAGAPGPSGATITILANGTVSPSTVTISRGQSVTIVNNDARVHDMTSDPHPTHTDCQEINAVGLLQPSQSKLTNALNTARTCGIPRSRPAGRCGAERADHHSVDKTLTPLTRGTRRGTEDTGLVLIALMHDVNGGHNPSRPT